MLIVMISGTLARAPEKKTSKNGNPFATATVRIPGADGDQYANVTAFGDLVDPLAQLEKGDPVTVSGTGKINTYEAKDGTTKAGLSVVASRVIALVDLQEALLVVGRPKVAPTSGTRPHQARSAPVRQSPPPGEPAPNGFDDEIPF